MESADRTKGIMTGMLWSLFTEQMNNDRYVIESADRPKSMWRQIHREIGKAPENEEKFELKFGNK
jgi:hypothetical protein